MVWYSLWYFIELYFILQVPLPFVIDKSTTYESADVGRHDKVWVCHPSTLLPPRTGSHMMAIFLRSTVWVLFWALFWYFVGTFTKSKPTSFIPLPPSDWQCYNGSLSRTFCWAAAEFASEAAHNHLSSAGYIYQPRYISPYPLHHHQLGCILCIPTLLHPLPCPAAPWRPGDPHVMV